MSFTNLGLKYFQGVGGSYTITSDTKSMTGTVYFAGTGSTWTFVDGFSTTGSTANVTIGAAGTLDTNDQTVTVGGTFRFSAGTTAVDLGTSVITCTAFYNATTIDPAGNHTIKVTGTGDFTGNGRTYYAVELNGTSHTIIGNNTFTTLTFNGTAAKTNTRTITAGSVQTIGTFKVLGNSAVNRPLVKSSTIGTHYHLAVTTFDTASGNFDIQDCTNDGTAWDFTSGYAGTVGDCGGNTNMTCTVADDCFWVHGATTNTSWSGDTGGNCWAHESGGTADQRVPLPQDTAIFDASSFAGGETVTQDMPRIGSVTFADTDAAFTFTPSTACSVFGDVTLDSNLTFGVGIQIYTFEKRGVLSLDSAGKTWEKGLTVNSVAGVGSVKLTSDLTLGVTRALTITSGTFTCVDGASNYVISPGYIYLDTNGTLTLGSATHLLTRSSGAAFTALGTVSASTGTIKITDAANGDVTFAAGTSKAYNNIWFDRGASTGTNTITATTALTLAEFKDTGTAAHSIVFTASITTTASTWTLAGTETNKLDLQSSTTTNATLSCTGAADLWYCTIKDITFSGGPWSAYNSLFYSTDVTGITLRNPQTMTIT